MYKKGTVLIRYKIDEWSLIGIGSIVKLEEDAHSKYGNYEVTRLKTVVLPGRESPKETTQGVNIRDFKPVPTLLQRKPK